MKGKICGSLSHCKTHIGVVMGRIHHVEKSMWRPQEVRLREACGVCVEGSGMCAQNANESSSLKLQMMGVAERMQEGTGRPQSGCRGRLWEY